MAEWFTVTLMLLALVVHLCRRGWAHLVGRWFPWVSIGLGAAAGWLVESLPTSPFPARPSMTTAIAVGIGAFSGRIAARAMAGWGAGLRRDAAEGLADPRSRMLHPLLGAGLLVFGSALAFVLVALRFESLEILGTPRDESTMIVRGGEEVLLRGDPHVSHAALLLHGYLGSPADFGDLPQRLAARGIGVRSLRLPGHATGPSVLDELTPDTYTTAVQSARRELATRYARVSIVGFSFGGALALDAAAEAPPYRLVLVNPYLGRTATPAWCPVASDTLMSIAAATTPRVFRPPGLTRCNDPEGLARQRSYSTVRTRAAVTARDIARAAASPETAAKITQPTLLLLSDEDRTAPSEHALAWYATLPGPGSARKIVRFGRSDHLLFLDHDREEAYRAVVTFLADRDE